jgi:hypothetical protein
MLVEGNISLETESTGFVPSGPQNWKEYLKEDLLLAAVSGAVMTAGMYLERQPSHKIAGRVVKFLGGFLATTAAIDATVNGSRLASNWFNKIARDEEESHFEYMMRDIQ